MSPQEPVNAPDDDGDPVAELVDLLRLTREDGGKGGDVFTGHSQRQPHGRVFGGQVLAQSLMAAGLTIDDAAGDAPVERPRHVHSMHAYFLRPGDASRAIRFAVERLRDGHSFSARRVHAFQDEEPILSCTASFQTLDDGFEHQDDMPDVAPPEDLPTVHDLVAGEGNEVALRWITRRAIDVRHVDTPLYLGPSPERASRQDVWIRADGRLPDDPLLHAAVFAYASDYTLLEPALRRNGLSWGDRRLRPASLDHAMWFHRPARADEWTLYSQASPSAQGGRGLGIGRMFSRDGRLVASVAQEGMLRLKTR